MNRPHITFLDHIRGVAILLVVIFHSLVPAYNRNHLSWDGWLRDSDAPPTFYLVLPAAFGWSGVAIFFVVSGFCIHLSFQRSPVWKEFFVRRFFRIYPPYLFALLLFAGVFEGRRLHFSSFADYAQFISHLFLLHNLDPRTLYGIVGSFWSIAVEVQLYLLYPLLLVLIARWGWRRSFIAVASVEVLLRLAGFLLAKGGDDMPKWIIGLPFTYWLSWAIGVAVADAYLHKKPLPFATWPIPLLLVAALASGFFKPLNTFSFLLFSLVTAAGIAKLLNGERLPVKVPALLADHLRRAGLWSYSIYLLHQPIVESVPWVLARLFPNVTFPALAVFAICALSWFIVLPLAGIWYRLFEVTGIDMGRRFASQPTGR